MADDNKASRGRSPPGALRPEGNERPFDMWRRNSFTRWYDEIASEPLPDDLLNLIDSDAAQGKQNGKPKDSSDASREEEVAAGNFASNHSVASHQQTEAAMITAEDKKKALSRSQLAYFGILPTSSIVVTSTRPRRQPSSSNGRSTPALLQVASEEGMDKLSQACSPT